MNGRKHRPDYLLIVTMGVLVMIGLVVIYSISPVLSHKLVDDVNQNYFLYGQLRHLGVGLVGFFVASHFNWRIWKKLLPALLVLSGLSLVLMMIPELAITRGGATRWIGVGDFSFQPAELLKFTLVVLMAAKFAQISSEQLKNNAVTLWPTLAVLGIVALFVLVLQKDMGTMLVIAGIAVAIFYAAGTSFKQLGTLLGIGAGFGLLNIVLFPHRVERIMTYFNPTQSTTDTGYHLNQALIAIGSGGLFGLGLGKSVQVYGYLPEAANDSIFAIIAETFGLVGSSIVLLLFGVLLYRCVKISLQAPDKFSQLLVTGITTWIGLQAAINMMAMLGIIPLTGITLPFLSYGGTSLVFIMIAMGMVVNISRYTDKGKAYADNLKRRRYGRSYNTAFGSRPSSQILR